MFSNRKASRRRLSAAIPAVIEALASRQMLSTTLISAGTDGNAAGATAFSSGGSINMSDDGRFVLFFSTASNLVGGVTDTNNADDLFVRDTLTNTTRIVSVDANGAATGVAGTATAIFSPDSRFLLTQATTANLVAGVSDTNGAPDLFLRDLLTGDIQVVSRNPLTGATGNLGVSTSEGVQFTADSTKVVYVSSSDDLVDAATGAGTADVYLYEIATHTNSLVSANTAGNGHATGTAASSVTVSDDGRYVAFTSSAGDLDGTASDTNASADAYVRDLQTGKTRLASRTAAGSASGGLLGYVFTSSSELIIRAGGNIITGVAADAAVDQLVLYRPATDALVAISVASDGTTVGNKGSAYLGASANGTYIAFSSASTNLASNSDIDSLGDLYIHNVVTGATTYIAKNQDGFQDFLPVQFSGDSTKLLFVTSGPTLISSIPDNNSVPDIYLLDLPTLALTMVSVNATGTASAGSVATATDDLKFSPDSKSIVFASDAPDLATDFPFASSNLYLYDIAEHVSRPVTLSVIGGSAGYNTAASNAVFSADSKYLVFVTDTAVLATSGDDYNFGADIYAYDIAARTRSLLTAGTSGNSGNGIVSNTTLFLTTTGDRVAYFSNATDYVAGPTDTAGTPDLFVTTLPGVNPTPAPAEIALAGNSSDIPNGTTTPSTTLGTDFGTTQLGVPVDRVFTVTNTGAGALQILNLSLPAGFTLLQPLNASIAAGGSGTFTVRFLATAPASRGGNVVITSNDGDESTFSFGITATGAAAATSSATASVTGNGSAIASGATTTSTTNNTDFGQTALNAGVQRTFTVTNSGSDLLTLSNLSLAGSGFTIVEGLSESLAPGASDTFTIQLLSRLNGARNSVLSFATNDSAAPIYSFSLSGLVGQTSPPPPTSGAPDLVVEGGVTGVKAGSFVSGAKGGKASVKVFNRGDTTAAGNLVVSFYISSDATFDSADVLASAVTKKINLKAGKSIAIKTSFNYPQVTVGGNFFILAVADSAAAFTELNETNNTASTPAAIAIAPPFIDLSPLALDPKGKYVAGKNATASLLLSNPGNVAAKGSITAELFASANGTTDSAVSLGVTTIKLNLAAGKSKKLTLKGAPGTLPAGTYTLIAKVDTGNALAESSETNNTAFSTVAIAIT